MQIAIVLYPGMTALDAIGAYEVLRWVPDSRIRFVWHETGPIVVDSGVLALGVTHTFEETPAPDIVLVPGGMPLAVATDATLHAWLRKVDKTTTWTTSVCSGATVLAAAGLLDGRSATTHWMVQSGLAALGAKPMRDQRVVQDGKYVTAAGVSAGIDMALWLLGEIAGQERAETAQLLMEYDPKPPFDAGHPSKVSDAFRRKAMVEIARYGADSADAGMLVGETIAVPKLLWQQTIRRIRARWSKST
ncbi:DJ-1/PfpI family protein [Nocardia sp. NPDC050175]|uniref:DJ-1/PfpI family protein n=1 Tax=Nocardia sp. NPDC050175 TaxID=3364317 RepID=UPI0037A1A7A4